MFKKFQKQNKDTINDELNEYLLNKVHKVRR